MLRKDNIIGLRMKRQHLTHKANEEAYLRLYRDLQPGQNVYWNGFGEPPTLTFRASFNDLEFNRQRQFARELIKGRFQGGNLGWIIPSDLELFAALYVKPLTRPTEIQQTLLNLIECEGPMNIALMKEYTGLLAKEITKALHRLQEAFMIYEDQYDGQWDRAWFLFTEKFPDVDPKKFTRIEGLKQLLQRFAYRHVVFNAPMVKSFYKLTNKDIQLALSELEHEGIILPFEDYYMLRTDYELLSTTSFSIRKSVFVMHRNDFLVKSNEYWLKEKYKQSESDILYYILIDGEFRGAATGKFKNGPYFIEDIVLDESFDAKVQRKSEIIEAVYRVNSREHSPIQRYCGELL